MRKIFDRQLTELRQELITLYADIDVALHAAVFALVEADIDKAKETILTTRQLDERCSKLENKAYDLIVLQQPVASDLRLLQFIIYVNFNLSRMSNHVRNVAKTARRTADKQVPRQLLDLVASEAHLVYRVMRSAVEAIVDGDLEIASSLPELDEPVDTIYKQFYKTFAKLPSDVDMDAATKVIMSARMLERISDNAVESGERLVFLLTGRHRNLDDLADLEEEELEKLRVVQGRCLTSDTERDAKILETITDLTDEFVSADDSDE